MTQAAPSESLKFPADARPYLCKMTPKEYTTKRDRAVERALNRQAGGFFSSTCYAFYPEWTSSFTI